MPEKDAVRAIERALLKVVRGLGKRKLGRMTERDLEGLVDFSHIAVVDTLGDDEERESVTIGLIARKVELDHSRASRMVAAAIKAGYARRVASQDDGRRTCVALTDKGEEFAHAIKNLRHKFFTAHLRGWSEEDCREFARLLTLFANGAKRERTEHNSRAGSDASLPESENVVVLHTNNARKVRKRRRRERA